MRSLIAKSKQTKMPYYCSLRHHHLDELFVIDLTVTVHIRFPDHLVDLLVRQFLPEVRHDMAQLSRADKTISISVKNLESLDQLLFRVRVFHLTSHQRQKLWEINGAVTVCIDLVNHVLQLGLRRILAQ